LAFFGFLRPSLKRYNFWVNSKYVVLKIAFCGLRLAIFKPHTVDIKYQQLSNPLILPKTKPKAKTGNNPRL